MPSNPSKSVKIMQKQKKPEPKTIYGHISDAMGLHLQKHTKKSIDYLTMIKNLILGLATFLGIGYVIGTISDIFLRTGYLGQVGALVMLLLWILRKGGKYLRQ